ncbi:unnamed protein product [Rhizophagus irregularis]|nr:unnamed protein product [Rhizophagus irregularis]
MVEVLQFLLNNEYLRHGGLDLNKIYSYVRFYGFNFVKSSGQNNFKKYFCITSRFTAVKLRYSYYSSRCITFYTFLFYYILWGRMVFACSIHVTTCELVSEVCLS